MDKYKDRRSLSLEVISRGDRLKNFERRKLPRLSLTSEQFRLNKSHRIFSVCDLSEKGMGLWILDEDDSSLFSVGLEIEGTLNLKREKYEIQAKVRNVSLDRVGCEFESLSPELAAALERLLDPKFLGAELKPLPSNSMNSLWYHGPSGTDLIFRRLVDGQFERVSLYVFGYFVQWDETGGVKTGRTHLPEDQRSEVRGIIRLETLLLDFDAVVDSKKLDIAKKIILSSNLPQDLKSWSIRQFEKE